MTQTCSECGRRVYEIAEWQGLRVYWSGEVFWRGIKRLRLPRAEGMVLHTLCLRGEAAHLALEMVSTKRSTSCISVHISRLRRKLREHGIPIKIENIPALGYRLVLVE